MGRLRAILELPGKLFATAFWVGLESAKLSRQLLQKGEFDLSVSKDSLIHATALDSTVRCMAAVTTNLVDEACRRHKTFPTASAALGRTLTGTLLLGSTLKDLEKIIVQFHCNGMLGGIVAEADAHGNVRGYVNNPLAHVPVNGRGKLDVSAIVGDGMMHVTREAGFEIGLLKDSYRGSVPIVSGEISEDFAYYLTKSEQVPSAVSLGVFVEPEECRVIASGGFIVQVMPGADKSVVERLEESIQNTPHSTKMILNGDGPHQMLRTALGDLDFEVLEEREIRFQCRCSYERAVKIISALGREEVADMLNEDGGAEMICHFCSAVYNLDSAELQRILDED